jgi:ADP-heptose:LPS heptosyltransferase
MHETWQVQANGIVTDWPLRLYTGILGQIGDIVMFTATVRRLKELFPRGQITFAVSRRYREAGELVAGLPSVDRLFVTELYFEKLRQPVYVPWNLGWPLDLRGEDEAAEQRRHDIVLETRPRHRREPWWEYAHQVAETAHMVGVPGPIDLRTEIAIPPGTVIPPEAAGKIVLHNDPAIDATKAWPWERVRQLVAAVGPEHVVLLGNPGPAVDGVCDLRGRTTLPEAAAIVAAARCYVGIDSGLMWIAGSLQAPVVGLYGTSYIAAYHKIQPLNPNAEYLQAEGALDRITVNDVLTAIRRIHEGGGAEGVGPGPGEGARRRARQRIHE